MAAVCCASTRRLAIVGAALGHADALLAALGRPRAPGLRLAAGDAEALGPRASGLRVRGTSEAVTRGPAAATDSQRHVLFARQSPWPTASLHVAAALGHSALGLPLRTDDLRPGTFRAGGPLCAGARGLGPGALCLGLRPRLHRRRRPSAPSPRARRRSSRRRRPRARSRRARRSAAPGPRRRSCRSRARRAARPPRRPRPAASASCATRASTMDSPISGTMMFADIGTSSARSWPQASVNFRPQAPGVRFPDPASAPSASQRRRAGAGGLGPWAFNREGALDNPRLALRVPGGGAFRRARAARPGEHGEPARADAAPASCGRTNSHAPMFSGSSCTQHHLLERSDSRR